MNQEKIHYVPKTAKQIKAEISEFRSKISEIGSLYLSYDRLWLKMCDYVYYIEHEKVDTKAGKAHLAQINKMKSKLMPTVEPQPTKEPLSFEEYLCKQYPDAFTKENFKSWVIIDDTLHFEYKGYLIGCKETVSPIDREEAIKVLYETLEKFNNVDTGDGHISLPHNQYNRSKAICLWDALLSKGLLSKREEKNKQEGEDK